MNKYLIVGLSCLLVFLVGCNLYQEVLIAPELEDSIIAAAKTNNFEYRYVSSDLDGEYQYAMKGKYRKVDLGEIHEAIDGQPYDEIYYDVFKEIGYGYCSKRSCTEKDLVAIQVDYLPYDHRNPAEWLLALHKAKEAGEEMLGNTNTRILEFEDAPGNKGKMWVHSFDYIPMKIEYISNDGSEHSILFKDIFWTTARPYDTELPINIERLLVEAVTDE